MKLSSGKFSSGKQLSGNQNGGSRADVMIKIVLLFFTSLLSFSVGTFVGKRFSDSAKDEQKFVQSFNESEGDRTVANVEALKVDEETPKEDVLTDEDIAALADELTKTQMEEKAPEPKKVAKTQVEMSKPMLDKVANKIAGSTGEAPKKKAEIRQPANFPSVVAASTIGKYTVQIASYKSESEAMAHAEKLKSQGFGAFYVPAKVKGNTWFRVSIGVYPDRATANTQRVKIQKQANIASAIVQKIVR